MKPILFILSAIVGSILFSCKENDKTVKEEK